MDISRKLFGYDINDRYELFIQELSEIEKKYPKILNEGDLRLKCITYYTDNPPNIRWIDHDDIPNEIIDECNELFAKCFFDLND